MPIKKKGDIAEYYSDGVAIQPDYSLTVKNDGTIEGQVVFICDESREGNLPQVGSVHPKDSRCEMFNLEKTYMALGKIKATGSYFGITSAKTRPVISYTPNTNQDPVTSHPRFEFLAGTKSDPKNGAKFDDDTGEFLGWFNPAIKSLFGVEFYLTPATLISSSYWASNPPRVAKRMTRVTSITGFRKPDDVKEFMLLDKPYRQVGSFYQVTEQYMGSGPDGFSNAIYP